MNAGKNTTQATLQRVSTQPRSETAAAHGEPNGCNRIAIVEPTIAIQPCGTTPQFAPRSPARHRPRSRGIGRCSQVSYGRAIAERLEDSWCADKSASVWCAASNGCRRPQDRVRSTEPKPRRSGNTAESKDEATPTCGSERETAPVSDGSPRSR